MTNAFQLAALSALAVLAAGCGSTACDELADYISECGEEVSVAASETDCGDDTITACQSECGLAADCVIFSLAASPSDEYDAEVSAYGNCIASCSEETP